MPRFFFSFSITRGWLAFVTAVFFAATVHAQTVIPTGTTRYDANTPGAYILNSGTTRGVTSGGNEAIRIANSGTTGAYTLTIDGTASQTDTGRGIRTGNTGSGVNVSITIGTTGFVSGKSDDAIQGRNIGTFNLTNLGTLYSGPDFSATPSAPIITGRGLNLRDNTGGGTIVNGSVSNTTALIRADGGDAVRVGSNFTFTNYGTLRAAGVVNDVSANNIFNDPPLSNNTAETFSAGGGFSFEDRDQAAFPGVGATHSKLFNFGTVSGARHGVLSGDFSSNLEVTNHAAGQIIGRNGSGIHFGLFDADPSKLVVENFGIIRGEFAGVGNIFDRTGALSPTQDGDGDGVEADGAMTVYNRAGGEILGIASHGFDRAGRVNRAQGVSFGGGVVMNNGIIRGGTNGILTNFERALDGTRSGVAATTITNNVGGTIEGLDGFAIRLENKLGDSRDNDTIVNYGTIIGGGAIPNPTATVLLQGNGGVDTHSTGTLDGVTYTGTGSGRFIQGDGSAIQMGEGADVLTNYGTIIGNNGRAINMEGSDNTLNFFGGTISGLINGGNGVNNELNLGTDIVHGDAVINFQRINVATGAATLSGVVSGTELEKGGSGTLTLSGANDYTGDTTVAVGTLRVNNTTGSGTGSGDVFVDPGATLAGSGSLDGNLFVGGILAPGNSIGTLTVDGDATWAGLSGDAWRFELGPGGTSDRLSIGGDFLAGTGTNFTFNFLDSGTTPDTYVLVDWDGATSFEVEDFDYVALGEGLTGAFALNGNQLEFTVVPEPATSILIVAGALGLALGRRRRWQAIA
jgi:autotransporter-associated beta strand protein